MSMQKRNSKSTPQGKYWMLTIPHHMYVPFLPPQLDFVKGQLEKGGQDNYLHWQIVCGFNKKIRQQGVRNLFGPFHCELTRSEYAEKYCFKEDTAVIGTRFELGTKVLNRNSKEFWAEVKEKAKTGQIDEIDDGVYIQYYSTLKRIAKDNMPKPDDLADVCGEWWYGPPGVGKSRKVRELYPDAYYKMANKWWDGYQGQETVILDDVDPGHKDFMRRNMKIWTDRYSFIAEAKGGAMHIRPKKFVVTSNYKIDEVFDGVDSDAIKRRCKVHNCPLPLYGHSGPTAAAPSDDIIQLECNCGAEVFICCPDCSKPLCGDCVWTNCEEH